MLRCNIDAASQHHNPVTIYPKSNVGLGMLSDTNRSAAELRALASWYRQYAELAFNPAIWSSRLSTAEELERQALDLEASVSPA